jgi:sporulation protein YlmC with PRC-barrel domain
MDIEYGSEVADKNGKILGTVCNVIRNSWTGEISRFMVRQVATEVDLSFTPQDVQETTESLVKLTIAFDGSE